MANVTGMDGVCQRCEAQAVLVDADSKSGYFMRICLDCGDAYCEELSEEFWEDRRVGSVDQGKNYWLVESDTPAGICWYQYRSGDSVNAGLGWEDASGDEFRRWVHEHNTGRAPEDPEFIVAAYASVYNPGSRRWERAYVSTGVSEGYRYRHTLAEGLQLPDPWGDALKPQPRPATAVVTAPQVEELAF